VLHFRLSFDSQIHEELVADVEKSAVYATSRLHRLRIAPDRRAADIECADDARDEVTEKVRKLVAAMGRTFRSLGEPEELARTERRDAHAIISAADAFAELEKRRWARPLGRGQVGLAGGACALKRFIDDATRDLARTRFHAQEEDHPALIEPEVLARCGYFGSFPHSVCLVSHLAEDFDGIEAFRAANTESATLHVPDANALRPDAVLRPAICLPVYRALEGSTVARDGLAVTTTGKAFRYESRNMEGMQRLWDFSMREIIFIGAADFVDAQRERVVRAMTSLMEEWDLTGRLVSATDPFFATVRGTKALWQRSRALKYEMMIDVGAGSIAAGSINFAGELFGNAFGIQTADGKSATTACVGFGLERLVLALFCQHGFAPERWPHAMREVVFG
jgi:seryl-tRNA synthetase